MVVGNGMIANTFESYRTQDRFIIFASGVSNSTNTSTDAFEREKKLVAETLETAREKLFVYFSTCSIYDPSLQNSAYVQHKIRIENMILQSQTAYVIFRLSNPIGRTGNTTTVLNYFIKHIHEKQEFTVWKNAGRNLIDIDDLYTVCNEILQQKHLTDCIINICNPQNYMVTYIIETIEKHFDIKGYYTLLDKGGAPVIDLTSVESLFTKFNINFDENYLPDLLQKYFPKK